MLQTGSVTHWIQLFKDGDRDASKPLWERYHKRIIGLARKSLQESPQRYVDEEDVAQEAFNSFFLALEAGRFPRLSDRDELWRLLVVITKRKSIDQVRRARSQGTARGLGNSAAKVGLREDDIQADFERIVADDPTPEMAVQLVEEYERLLFSLDDPKLQQIAVWKLEGFHNGQIADKLQCSRRTVIRKLETIRLIWKDVAAL
jgi:RNA polymerase sigma factor (sigma-70 family)